MESPPPLARYVTHSSKKIVFPGGNSTDEEVAEIPPPVNETSMSLKQKEISLHDIIDLDVEDDYNEARLGKGTFVSNGKGKEIFIDLSLGPCDGSEITTAVKGCQSSKKKCTSGPQNVINLEDSELFGEDKYMYYDEMLGEYKNLQSHFDRVDVPAGEKISTPCLPFPTGDKMLSSCNSIPSNPLPQLKTTSISSGKTSPLSSEAFEFGKVREKATSSGSTFGHRTRRLGPSVSLSKPALGKKRSAATEIDTNSKQKSLGFHQIAQSQKGLHFPHEAALFGSHNLSAQVGSSFPNVAAKSSTTDWINFPPNYTNHHTIVPLAPPSFFSGPVPGGLLPPGGFVPFYPDPLTSLNYATAMANAPISLQSPSIGAQPTNIDEIIERFRAFKKFDTVQDYSDHYYSGSASKKPSKALVKRIQEEWKSLKKDLPDKIFVRVYESKMDLLRAVIVGAAGTPYHDGLFFFDVHFPCNYPNVPPKVHYHSGGLRINPNLYNCGKVCLSLLNTWSGSGKEKWIPNESTMLQVLVSIQGLILNAKPYFNEPGLASSAGTPIGERGSLQYNENTYILNLRTMVYSMQKPAKHFEDFVAGHFILCAQDILVACKTYIEGAQVGSLVSGGVQDVDEGDTSCSDGFKNTVAGFIKTLVNSFTKVGAKDCDKFLFLAEKATGLVSPPMMHYY